MKEPIIVKAQRDVLDLINQATAQKIDLSSVNFSSPPDPSWGDLAYSCFDLIKIFSRRNPTEIAKGLASIINEQLEAIKRRSLVEKVEAHGPYLNFFFESEKLAQLVLRRIKEQKNEYGSGNIGKNKKVMVEYCAPNTNKPLTLGHIRNIALGWSIIKLLEAQNYKVIKTDLRNDRGVAICKSMLGWQKWGNGETPRSSGFKGDHLVGKYYVEFNKKEKEMPELKAEIQECLKKWEKGDRQTRRLWQKMRDWVIKGFEETYQKLGVSFDKIYYESDYYDKGTEIVRQGFKKGVFALDENKNIVALLEKYNLPDKVVLRADGTAIYTTQDIYLAQLKFKDFKLDKSIYVVGSEQNLYFKQLFKILKLLGYDWVKNCYHRSYGLIALPEGRMKSREGTVVDADDIIAEMIELAQKEIKEREEKISNKELQKRAQKIGLSALKYFILEIDPDKGMTFDPKKSIVFNGRTGPYIQYTVARISSILKKSKLRTITKIDFSKLNSPAEHQLVMLLAQFPQVTAKSAENYNPAELARYLYNLAKEFSNFYRDHSVIKAADKETAKARIFLITSIRLVLTKGLELLGIEAVERM